MHMLYHWATFLWPNFSLFRNLHTVVFQSSGNILHSTNSTHGSDFSIFSPILNFFFIVVTITGMRCNCYFICISSMVNDTEYLFIYLFASWISSLEDYESSSSLFFNPSSLFFKAKLWFWCRLEVLWDINSSYDLETLLNHF